MCVVVLLFLTCDFCKVSRKYILLFMLHNEDQKTHLTSKVSKSLLRLGFELNG